jgi:hypothetical protein
MGQAKQRKAEIDKLKADSARASNDFGVLDVMFKFGDGEWADHNRNEMLYQIIQSMKSNLGNIVVNTVKGKTTRAQGIQVGFEPGKMTTISDYHISVESSNLIDAMAAFEQAFRIAPKKRLLECGMMSDVKTKTLSPFMAFMNPGCNIIITKWAQGTIIRFFDDTHVDRFDATGDPEVDAESIAKYAEKHFV